jgi:hypothetical protein
LISVNLLFSLASADGLTMLQGNAHFVNQVSFRGCISS